MENYRNQPDSEENAWPTVLTALPTSGANMNSEEEQEYENENTNENENENEELAPATLPVATARSMTSNNGRTPQLQAAAHSRGLTSTLSGRRQRQELLSHDIHQQHRSPSAASTVPDMLDSQTPIDAPPAFATRRNSSRAAQDSPRQNQQQLVPKGQSAWSDSSRRNSGYKNTSIGAGADTVFGNANEDDDDEDAPPPESLLVEVSPQKHSEPPAAPVRRYTSSRDQGLQLHQAINWADAQPQRPAPEPSSSGGGGTTGFVRRAAHAVHSRIQDISSHAADAPRLGAPMPPPRRRSREPYGDGRAFSVADSASIAWPRRDARQQRSRASSAPLSYRERALRSWRDSKYQDEFFCRVYAYYAGKGALTIVLSRVLQLVTLAFVVVLSTFVLGCIDHAKVRKQRSLSEVVVPQCTRHFSWTVTLALSSFLLFWLAQMVRTLMELPLLLEIRAFYTEVLGIQPADIGTLAWHEVVSRMVKLRDVEIREYRGLTKSRVLGHRLTADGIVNRIMRRENYMIALFNKGLLNITIPGLGKEQVLTKALEWNLSFCLMSYLFDERGQ
ncbi:autophagy protein atg9, partial [Kickxella alabastrina]